MCISTSKCIKRRKNKVKDIKQNAKLTFFKETNKNSNRLNSFSTIDFHLRFLAMKVISNGFQMKFIKLTKVVIN